MEMKIKAANVKLKRAYERPYAGDGTRILIDRYGRVELRK